MPASDSSDPATEGPGSPGTAGGASAWGRLFLLGGLLGAGALSVAVVEPQRLLTEDSLGQPGAVTLVLFVLIYAALSVAMVPRPVMGLAGGALFGSVAGAAAALVGTMLGAAATFVLGRLLGQRALRALLRGRLLTAADQELSSHGFRSLLVLRLIAVLPFAAVNHAAAVSRMPWGPFLGATAVGCTPGVVAYAVAGSYATDPISPAFLSAVGFLVVSALLAASYRRRRQRRTAAAGDSSPADGESITPAVAPSAAENGHPVAASAAADGMEHGAQENGSVSGAVSVSVATDGVPNRPTADSSSAAVTVEDSAAAQGPGGTGVAVAENPADSALKETPGKGID